jgi:hypothetical protein
MAVNFFDQFSIQTDKPIDLRMTVATHADLYASSSYSNGLYAHKGMIVTVLADETHGGGVETYRLATAKTGYNTAINWERLAAGSTELADLSDVDIVNVQEGDVLAYDNNTMTWVNIGPVVETIQAGTSGFTIIKTDGSEEFINIVELDPNIQHATTTTAGIVLIGTINDIRTGTDQNGVSGALKTTTPSAVKQFVEENRDLVYPPPTTPYDTGDVGTWSYDDYYVYFCVPYAGTAGTSGQDHVWRRTRVEIW